MKVYLSNKSPSDQSFKHCSNLAVLDAAASDSEITKLTIDCFLCSFSFEEVGEAMTQILKKCRMKCAHPLKSIVAMLKTSKVNQARTLKLLKEGVTIVTVHLKRAKMDSK